MNYIKLINGVQGNLLRLIEKHGYPKGVGLDYLNHILKRYNENLGSLRRSRLLYDVAMTLNPQSDYDTIIDLSTAVELFQNFALIQDDIMDNAMIRRGSPTFHHQVLEELSESENTNQLRNKNLSNSLSILSSDMLLLLSIKCINNVNFSSAKIRDLLDTSLDIYTDTCHGQALDLQYSDDLSVINENNAGTEYIYEKKTTKYSFILPIKFGVAIAKEPPSPCIDEKTICLVEQIGKELGYCFQVLDDLHAIYGNSSEKDTLTDLYELKFTSIIEMVKEARGVGTLSDIYQDIKCEKIHLALGKLFDLQITDEIIELTRSRLNSLSQLVKQLESESHVSISTINSTLESLYAKLDHFSTLNFAD